MWIFFALLTPLFWSIVHVVDSHCVGVVFEKPWMGVVTGALTSLIVIILLPFFVFLEPSFPSVPSEYFLLAMLAGALIQASQYFYFRALYFSEAGIVAAYWNLTPALLPVAGFVLFRDVLPLFAYLGIMLLIFSSVGFCLIDSNLHSRWSTFISMLAASILQVAALLIEDRVFDHMSYLQGFLYISLGLVITGLLPLLIPSVAKLFLRNMQRLSKALYMLFGVEIANLFALASSQKAISLGHPALVASVETTVPAYTFILSIILLEAWPKFGDINAYNKLGVKIFLVLAMVLGVVLLS